MNESSSSAKPVVWDAETLWQQLAPLLPDLGVEVVARADSTNTQLLQRYRGALGPVAETAALPGRRAGDAQPCLLVADYQTAGRGRMGRSWLAAPGASLTFSLALPLAAVDWSGLSLAVGVALAEALDPTPPASGDGTEEAAPRIGLKWPNDLWLHERKLGGVLIETLAVGSQRLAVIGIGLNVLPMEGAAANPHHASLSEIDPQASAPAALHRIALPLVRSLREFEREGFAAFLPRYVPRDVLTGRQVRCGTIEGIAQGVSAEGGLRILTEGGEVLVTSNEVSVRLNPWEATTQSGQP